MKTLVFSLRGNKSKQAFLLATEGLDVIAWRDKVQIGEMSVDEVETYINRPDINPKDWADYEDGWRPSGW